MKKKIIHVIFSGLGGHANVLFPLLESKVLNDYNHVIVFFGIEAVVPSYLDRSTELGVKTHVVQKKTKQYLKETDRDLKIIVEARDLDEIKEILESDGVYRILIDNFNYEDTRTAVALIGDKCLTESSGGINEKTIRNYAECGVDYISSGALTHSVYNMDLSLKAV